MSQDFSPKTVDWRSAIRNNKRKTYIVIAIFILIFFVLGFLIDFIWRYNEFVNLSPQFTEGNLLTPKQLFVDLITFRIIPYATLIALGITLIWIGATFKFYTNIMLWGTSYEAILENTQDLDKKQLYNVVDEMSIAAGMPMPKVYLVHAPYMNAFATGISSKSALIAVTKPLVDILSRDELTAVVAHELSHIRNHDIQVNLFVVVLSNMLLIMVDLLYFSALFQLFGGGGRKRENSSSANIMQIVIVGVIVLRFALPLLTAVLYLFLSRTREYMADAGAVQLTRTNVPLAEALVKISQEYDRKDVQRAYKSSRNDALRRPLYFFSKDTDWMSTHPSLKNRLQAIGIDMHTET